MDRTDRRFRARRRAHLGLECLEDRTLPALAFHFTYDDPGNQLAAFPTLKTDVEAAGQILSRILDGQGTIDVRIRPNSNVDRAGGYTLAVSYVGASSGMNVYEHGAVAEARTGVDPNGTTPDVGVDFNVEDYLSLGWFDPTGAARTGSLPSDRIDFMSVVMHEMLHGLGMQGYRTLDGSSYGGFPGTYETVFDSLTQFGAGGDPNVLYFLGASATARYGGPVPLTTWGPNNPISDENFYHLGNPSPKPGSDLASDLMNGITFAPGIRYRLTEMDLAVLTDLGWKLAPSPVEFASSSYQVREDGGVAVITVQRVGSTAQPLSVRYSTASGTATAGADYDSVAGELRWAAGEDGTKTFAIPIRNDGIADGAESLRLLLTSTTPDQPLGQGSVAVLTIADAPPPPVQPLTGDVTTAVQVTATPAKWNNKTRRFERTFTLTNVSGRLIQGAISLFLTAGDAQSQKRKRGPAKNVRLLPMTLRLDASQLAPGQSFSQTILSNEHIFRFGWTSLRVLADG